MCGISLIFILLTVNFLHIFCTAAFLCICFARIINFFDVRLNSFFLIATLILRLLAVLNCILFAFYCLRRINKTRICGQQCYCHQYCNQSFFHTVSPSPPNNSISGYYKTSIFPHTNLRIFLRSTISTFPSISTSAAFSCSSVSSTFLQTARSTRRRSAISTLLF